MQPKLNNTAYADHLRGCADLAVEISARMGVHEDAARQACFATVIINAERHNIFMEPTPQHSKTPVIQPEPAAVVPDAKKGVETAAAELTDARAAAKADAQINDAPRNPTSEEAEDAKLTVLRDGVNKVRALLNAEGYTPPLTPARLTALIKSDLDADGGLEALGVDELDLLLKTLNRTLDNFRHNKKAIGADEVDF